MKRAEPVRRRRIVAMTAAAALAVAGALAALADPPLRTSSLQSAPSASARCRVGQAALGTATCSRNRLRMEGRG